MHCVKCPYEYVKYYVTTLFSDCFMDDLNTAAILIIYMNLTYADIAIGWKETCLEEYHLTF